MQVYQMVLSHFIADGQNIFTFGVAIHQHLGWSKLHKGDVRENATFDKVCRE